MIFENLLPLYFPRSHVEEADAARLLPMHGERLGRPPPPSAAQLPQPPELSQPLGANPLLSTLTAPVAPGTAQTGAPAACRAVNAAAAASAASPSASAYAAFLQRAGLADLTDLESMQLFYRAGSDSRGRPVFMLWAGHLPQRAVDLDRVLMHIFRVLDP